MENIYVKKANADDLYNILNILDSATAKLLEKGVMQWEYPWDERQVLSFILKGEFYTVSHKNIPCGCFGLKDFPKNNFVPADKNGLYRYHLAVHPGYDKAGIGFRICEWIQEYSKSTGKNIYFDCWAGNQKLINYYTFMGFKPLGQFPEEDYFVYAFSAF